MHHSAARDRRGHHGGAAGSAGGGGGVATAGPRRDPPAGLRQRLPAAEALSEPAGGVRGGGAGDRRRPEPAAVEGPVPAAACVCRRVTHLLPLQQPAQEKCSDPPEAALGDEASTEKPQEELGTTEPEQDGGCSDVEPSAQLQSKEQLSSVDEGDSVSPPNLGADADKDTEKGHSAPAESQDWQEDSSISSVWDSTVLEPESLRDYLEIPLEDIKELPRTRSGLQAYRNHLLMELLWLQQAIASRENYLMLKQGLGTPDP